jgi:hypothetical protein
LEACEAKSPPDQTQLVQKRCDQEEWREKNKFHYFLDKPSTVILDSILKVLDIILARAEFADIGAQAML